MTKVVADLTGFEHEFVKIAEDAKEEYKKDVYFAGTFPYLQDTESGEGLGESAAIARFMCNSNPDSGLYGSTAYETAQIDEVIDGAKYIWGVYVATFFPAVLGYFPVNEQTFKDNSKKFKDYLRSLDEKLKDKEFILGDKLSLADVFLVVTLNLPFALIVDAGFRKAIPNLTQYYTNLRANETIVKHLGKARLAGKGFKPKFA